MVRLIMDTKHILTQIYRFRRLQYAQNISNLKAVGSLSKYAALIRVSLCLAVGLAAHFGYPLPLGGGAVFGIVFGIIIHNTISAHRAGIGINYSQKYSRPPSSCWVRVGPLSRSGKRTQSFLVIITPWRRLCRYIDCGP